LGNNSESGNNILYYFRQENNLPKDNFLIEDKKYQNIVYIDDVTISGTQAARYINSSNIDSEHRYFASLIASEEAIKYINGKNIVEKVIYSTCLDERERAFAEESHMFADKNICDIKNIIKTFCQFYGEKVNKKSPLGYKDGQYMIGLVHNTPNNTLPIFWETHNGWQPIFKRYPKIISGKEREFDGDKYY
jgi:hypothetical protein